jgi:hypothetical protein
MVETGRVAKIGGQKWRRFDGADFKFMVADATIVFAYRRETRS